MAYHQITSAERYTIAALRREGFNRSQIARHLGRHRSTISRELRRNAARHDGAYRPHGAIERTSARRSRSRRNTQFSAAELAAVERLLRKKWSPEQISGRLRREGRLRISHETIYRHVWRDKFEGGALYCCLRQATKLRRKRHNSYDRRGRLPGKRHISERPASVERRHRVGHWEIDTVVGSGEKDCVVTLVERKTGYAVIGKLADRSAGGMARRVTKRISSARGQLPHDHLGKRHRVSRVRKGRKGDGRALLLRDALPLVGARHERELQRSPPAVPAEENRPGSSDPEGL
jgi:transposase, IS30 family